MFKFYNDRLLRLSNNLESSIWIKFRKHTQLALYYVHPPIIIPYRIELLVQILDNLSKQKFKTKSLSNKTAFFQKIMIQKLYVLH